MKTQIIITILLFFSLFGCSDFLEVDPLEDVSINEQFSNLAGTLEALNGAYEVTGTLFTNEAINYYSELVAGNSSFAPTNLSDGQVVINSRISNAYDFRDLASDSDLEGFYDNSYAAINNTNQILSFVDDLPDASLNQINQIKAEALTLRAFLHFNLLRVYSQHHSFTSDASHLGIIYNTRPLIAGVDFPARLTNQESFDLVISDLNTALELYTNNQAINSDAPWSYFTEVSARAFLARVYLYAEQFQNAIDTASQVIADSGVSLLTSGNYTEQWELPELPVSEVLFEFSPGQNDGVVSNTIAQIYATPSSNSISQRSVISSTLMDLFAQEDIRGENMTLTEDISTLNQTTGIEEPVAYFFTKKFQDSAGSTEIRLSEMYLIRAEANARLNNLAESLQDLNTIHTRAGNTTLIIDNQQELLDEIFDERRRELCFERHLLFDYGRFQKDINQGANCPSEPCILEYPSNFYILPIPQDNLFLNENIIQNEGY